jgi:hypothetical protein
MANLETWARIELAMEDLQSSELPLFYQVERARANYTQTLLFLQELIDMVTSLLTVVGDNLEAWDRAGADLFAKYFAEFAEVSVDEIKRSLFFVFRKYRDEERCTIAAL